MLNFIAVLSVILFVVLFGLSYLFPALVLVLLILHLLNDREMVRRIRRVRSTGRAGRR